ncbi:hypothetical protein [Cryobacterium sp. N19]|uniref:hypothetical protein n=1 Tax=Cryobacterium sp. N19 TaxID=2048288 RepID=UPI0013047FB5|nr:hypothetical protein [Cryobacterium sp. N19]
MLDLEVREGNRMPTLESLMDTATGIYLVSTRSGSRYMIDLNEMKMSRVPAETDPNDDLAMRRDGETVDLLSVDECTVGRPMRLVLDLHVEGVVVTSRQTTTVDSISEVNPADVDLTAEELESP